MSNGFVPDVVECSPTFTHALKRPLGHAYVFMHIWSNLHSAMIQREFSLRFPTAKISMTWFDGEDRYPHATSDSRSLDVPGRLKSIRQNSQQTTR